VRGSQVSFTHPHAYAIMQALIGSGTRFGLTPLYLGFDNLWGAVAVLLQVMATEAWRARACRSPGGHLTLVSRPANTN
jgi:kynureninase